MTNTTATDSAQTRPKLPGTFQNVPIIVSLYHLYQSFHVLLPLFPKSQRYSLGTSCQAEMLAMMKQCLRAAGSSNPATKARALQEASVNLDTIRLLLCLCKDCRCISNQAYQQLDSTCAEVGRMLGGWLKSLTSSP